MQAAWKKRSTGFDADKFGSAVKIPRRFISRKVLKGRGRTQAHTERERERRKSYEEIQKPCERSWMRSSRSEHRVDRVARKKLWIADRRSLDSHDSASAERTVLAGALEIHLYIRFGAASACRRMSATFWNDPHLNNSSNCLFYPAFIAVKPWLNPLRLEQR